MVSGGAKKLWSRKAPLSTVLFGAPIVVRGMQSQMMEERFRKSLTRYEGRKGVFLCAASIFMPLFLVVMGGLNLWLAARIGGAADITLTDYVQLWLNEIEVEREYTYSGVFLAGLHRFNTALLQFSFAIVLTPLVWGIWFQRKRDRAVVDALKKHGEI